MADPIALIQSFAAGPQRLVPALWVRSGSVPASPPGFWRTGKRGFWWLFFGRPMVTRRALSGHRRAGFGTVGSFGPLTATAMRVDRTWWWSP